MTTTLRYGRLFIFAALILTTWISSAWAQVEIKDGLIHFGAEVLEWNTMVDTVSEHCKMNMMRADNVRGKKKLFVLTQKGISCEEFQPIYFFLLENMDTTLKPVGSYQVMEDIGQSRRKPSNVYVNDVPDFDPSQPQVSLLVEVKNIEAEEMLKVIDKLRSREGRMYTFNNFLLIFEFQAYIPRLLKFIHELDVGGDDTTRVYNWTPKNSPVEDVVEIAKELFFRKGQRGRDAAVGLEQMVIDERTNTVFIVGTEEACKRVLAFMPKLDIDIERHSGMEVVFLKFAKAEDLNSVLQSVVQKGRSRTKGQRQFGEDLEVKVTADKQTNSLILVGPPRGINELKRIIDELDRFPRQVFLEAVLLEVTATDNVDTGISVSGAKKVKSLDNSYVVGGTTYGSLNSVAIDPTSLMGLALGVRGQDVEGSGDAYGLGFNFPSFGALVRLLQTTSKVNILANPYLVSMDAEEAEIVVGSNVPFVTGTARDANNRPVLSIQRQDVALSVKMQPEINENRRVKLKLEFTIEDLASVSETLGPTTTKRALKTVAMAQSGSRIALGGLLREREIEDKEKVPVLGDIPIIGFLFRSTGKTKEKTNLMIVITPHILETPEDVRKIFKDKLHERSEYIRELYGEEDLKYGIPDDYEDRTGMVENIRSLIEAQKRESGNGSEENIILITPDAIENIQADEFDPAFHGASAN